MDSQFRDSKGRTHLPDSLASPLRLEILKIFIDRPGYCADVGELSRLTGRLRADVEGCLTPLLKAGLLVQGAGDTSDEVSLSIPPETRDFEELRESIERRYKSVAKIVEVRNRYFEGMIGVDEKMTVVFEMITRVAKSDIPVLILGPMGSGKDMVARAVHELSPHANGRFETVHCSMIEPQRLPVVLFGSAATKDKPARSGQMTNAANGTLFVNEIADLPLPLQEEFVRILDRHYFFPLGSTDPVSATFRLVTASQRSLEEMVSNGNFREDLFYKINAFPIRIPALRERLDDVVVLARDVLRRYCIQLGLSEDTMYFSEGAIQRLLAYSWPGNIRELENAVIRAAILAKGPQITESELSFLASPEAPDGGFRSLKDVEEEHIRRVLHHFRDNIRKAAQVLGISRGTLYERIQRYEIELSNRRGKL